MGENEIVNDRQAVYTYFMACRAAVKLSTFAVIKGVVNVNHVVVHDAPPGVVRDIVGNFKMVWVREDGGLMIPVTALP